MERTKLEKEVTKILSYKTWNTRKKTDALFEIDANLYMNTGIDSTKEEMKEVQSHSLFIYRAMKKIDWYLGSTMLHSLGKLM